MNCCVPSLAWIERLLKANWKWVILFVISDTAFIVLGSDALFLLFYQRVSSH